MINDAVLNGDVLGVGVSDVRQRIESSVTATATTTSVLTIYRYLESEVVPAATSSIVLKAVLQLAAEITAQATSVVTMTNYVAQYFSSSIVTSSNTSIVMKMFGYLAGTFTQGISTVLDLWRGRDVSGPITIQATSTIYLAEQGGTATFDRTISLPPENRTMKVD